MSGKLNIEVNEKAETNEEPKSTLATLYSFADRTDGLLASIGLFLALIQAALPPFVWLVMGDFVTFAIDREEVKAEHERELITEAALNLTDLDAQFDLRKHGVDIQFERAAMPVFISMFSLSVATFVAAFVQRLIWEFSGIRQVFRTRKAYIRKLLHMDVSWLESRHSGQVASTLNDHAASIYQGIADHVPMTIFIFSYLSVTLGVCFYIQWDVTLVMLMALPLLILTRLIFSKWFCKTMDDEFKLQNKMTNLVSETFNCIRTVISFGAQRQTLGKYERLAREHNRLTDERLRSSSVYDALVQVLFTELIFTAALAYGMVRMGEENAGRLGALAINMLYMCVTSITIGFHLNGIASAKQNAKEMQRILSESPNIEMDYADRDEDSPMDEKKSGVFQESATIAFRDVRFSYPTRPDVEVLKGVSLNIKAGEHLAIVGASGSGKSTLTALILRFYDPNSGTIDFDGVDVRHLNPDRLRGKIGIVSQEPALFDGTIGDNIRYGKLDADQMDIADATRRAEAWHFISQLPDGMRTRVGDRGLQLSGGQKQRVAIARAVLRKPSLIIFDEATSALDTKHETDVQKAIDEVSRGITTITIAHRLSTVKKCDRIIVLEDGNIVEEGTPADLMAKTDGHFFRMYADQKLDAARMEQTPTTTEKHPTLTHKRSVGAAEVNKILTDPEKRRAWARSSLGHHHRLGKSYSMSTDKLQLATMSNKRGNTFRANVMELTNPNGKPFDDETSSSTTTVREYSLLTFQLPGRPTNFTALAQLIRNYKPGYIQLAFAIPTTILRGLFFLLVCFQVASVLEITMEEESKIMGRLFNVVTFYTCLIIIKTIFEAVGRLSVALYGHGFCVHLRRELFRQLLRHGAAYFDEERNSPGRLTHKLINDTASLQTLATVVLSNMTTIKAYTLQDHFYHIFDKALYPLKRAMKRQSYVSAFVFACQFSFSYILIAVTLYFGKDMMLRDEITPFDYLRVVLLTQFGANFISQLIASVADFGKARVAAESVLSIMREPPIDTDNLTDEGLRPKTVGQITMRGVSFRYPSRPAIQILKHLTFRASPGQSVAIVGPSGSGKSTIIALLQRLYSPNNGHIFLDKTDIRQINPGYLRRIMVCVGQEPTLFSFTIKENIAYGLPEDEAPMTNIIEAAKIAKIHDFITSLPKGYDTEVGEFGAQLSGGQKQRIAIARAMVRKPAVLLFDEATAALDATSEKAVQQAVEEASKSCTCIHIAHRLSSIRTADKIIVLVGGEIAEQGTHKELMHEKGLYYEMNQLEL